MIRKSAEKPQLVGQPKPPDSPEVTGLDDVYAHIFASIVDQRLPPGTKLNELTLCEIFGVGRRQVAHVLNRLAHDRLITLHANRGAFVATPDEAEARTIFEARRIIECEISRMVAEKATPDMLAPLRANVAEETAHRRAGRVREAIRVSGAFHMLVGDLSGNEILSGLVRQLVARTSLVVSLYENESSMVCWHDDHGAFIGLLEEHRVNAAVKFMREHLLHVEQSLNFGRRAGHPLDLRRIYASSDAR